MSVKHTLRPLMLTLCTTGCMVDYDVSSVEPKIAEPAAEMVEETPPEPAAEPPVTTDDRPTEPDREPPPEGDCDHTSDLIYVIERDSNGLYLFDPVGGSFDYQGDLDCDYFGSPNSMGVARDGVAYVRWSDQTVYEVDLQTLTCSSTSYNDNRTHFGSFGMGYATDSADTWRDRLYVANSGRLARLNTQTWQLDDVGPMPSQSELTGNADGELWAFLPLESPAALARLSKTTGSPQELMSLPSFPDPYEIDAFAFAHWDGEFWLFVRTYGLGSSSDVYRVDAQGRMTVVASDIGFDIVGAGVSTCAPSQ